MEVVVVLPWAPETATLYLMRISSASISALGMTGIFAPTAAVISGLDGEMAVLDLHPSQFATQIFSKPGHAPMGTGQ